MLCWDVSVSPEVKERKPEQILGRKEQLHFSIQPFVVIQRGTIIVDLERNFYQQSWAIKHCELSETEMGIKFARSKLLAKCIHPAPLPAVESGGQLKGRVGKELVLYVQSVRGSANTKT